MLKPKEAEPDAPPSEDSCDDRKILYKERSVWTEQLHDAFERGLIIPNLQLTDINNTFMPPENTGFWEDFTPMFLEQARLYVLTDTYCINLLCQLVLSKLYQTFKNFKLYKTSLNSTIEFVRFVYMEGPPNHGNKIDSMRNLATCYVVSVLGQIGENKSFREVLAGGGPFVDDF